MEQVQKQVGKPLEELKSPVPFPRDLSHVWTMFLELSATRSQGFSGPNAITYSEIKSWSELTDTPVGPLEVNAIKSLDRVYLRITYSARTN